MKTGDTVRDGSSRTFQVGQLLGRGLWGKTYTCREEPGGAEWILKVPLGPEAFPEDGERLARVCREVALEQGRLLGQGSVAPLVRPEARFTTETGIPVLVLPRLPASLRARMAPGMPLEGLLVAIAEVAGLLRGLGSELRVHGNLRPENILADGRGGWVLSDPATPTLLRHLPPLARARGVPLTWLPPEARSSHEQPLVDPSVDTHALAAALLVGALTPHDGSPPPMPDDGLDKSTLVALKDAVRNRLKEENTNPRFHARLSERLATVLNRALSRETSPSPPYRFPRVDELQARVADVAALARPRIVHVGRVLLDRPPGSETFTTDEDVAFSCSVGCTPGVENHEDIGTGLAVFDLDRDARLRDVPCSYTVDRHPSGRFRFGFQVAGLAPGRYRLRVAFTIRDSGEEPQTTEGEVTVHPAAGYVPPAAAPEPRAIAFGRKEAETTVTEVGRVEAPEPEAPAAEPPEDAPPPPEPVPLPRPIAPGNTSPGVLAGAALPVEIPAPQPRPAPPAPAPPEPQYRGAGRWTDLPLPGPLGPTAGATDPLAEDLTEPLDEPRQPGALDKLLDLTQGEAYKLFIGGAVVVILLLALALMILR